MRNFQKTLSVFVFAILLTGVLTLGGCELEKVDVVDSAFAQQLLSAKSIDEIAKISAIKDQSILKEVEFLKQMERITNEQYVEFHRSGLALATMDDGMIYYPIDGKAKNTPSYIPTREYVQEGMKAQEQNKSARHRRYQYMYAGGTVSVKVHQSVPIEWNTAVAQAVSYWNSLGVNITFSAYTSIDNTLESNKVDVTWGSYSSIAGTTMASGSGKFGEKIVISNTNALVADTTPEGRKVLMAHELGHAIGLTHTDVTNELNTSDVASATGCGSNAGADSRSIMRQYPGKKSLWQEFTKCDKDVINYYW